MVFGTRYTGERGIAPCPFKGRQRWWRCLFI